MNTNDRLVRLNARVTEFARGDQFRAAFSPTTPIPPRGSADAVKAAALLRTDRGVKKSGGMLQWLFRRTAKPTG